MNTTEITIFPDSSIEVYRHRDFASAKQYRKNNFASDSIDRMMISGNPFVRGSYSREWDKGDLSEDSTLSNKAYKEFNSQLERFGLEEYIVNSN